MLQNPRDDRCTDKGTRQHMEHIASSRKRVEIFAWRVGRLRSCSLYWPRPLVASEPFRALGVRSDGVVPDAASERGLRDVVVVVTGRKKEGQDRDLYKRRLAS